MLSRFLTLAFALYGVTAMPQSKRQDDPGCIANIPAEPDADTVNKVYLAGVAKNVNLLVSMRPRRRIRHVPQLNC